MKRKHLLALSLCTLVGGAFIASTAIAGDPVVPPTTKDAAKDATDKAKKAGQDAKKAAEDALKNATGDHGMPAMDPKAMAEMEKLMSPGPMQAMLKKIEGNWDLVVKSKMDPSMPWSESKATSKATMIMDGRYLQEDVEGTFEMPGAGPMKFTGRSMVAYDNGAKMFVSTWIDNMGTGMMVDKGQFEASTKTMTSEGDYFCPIQGKMCKSKSSCQWKDDNTRYMEMWATGPDGKMYNNMQITYTRKK